MASEWPVVMSEHEDSGDVAAHWSLQEGRLLGSWGITPALDPTPGALLAHSHCGPLGRLLQARPPRPAPLIDRQPGKRPLLWNSHQAITLTTA